MSGPALLVDSAVPAYAYGGEHPAREPCRQFVAAAARGDIEVHASVEMVQELLFHRMRMSDRVTALGQARDIARMCVLHDFDRRVLTRAMDLIAVSPSIGGRDAVHAATALEHGIETVVSPDKALDGIAGLRRVDPADALA